MRDAQSLLRGKESVDREALRGYFAVMKPQCKENVARACGYLGATHLGLGDETTAAAFLTQACTMGDYWACDLKRRLSGTHVKG